MAESKEELKSLLMKVKVESEKAGLKLNSTFKKQRSWHPVPLLLLLLLSHFSRVQLCVTLSLGFSRQEHNPITLWQVDGETMETVRDFIFGAPKSLQMVIAAMKLKDAYSLEEKLWQT